MNDCIFCKIIKGDIPSKTIHEDENIKVIMDVNPKSNGHLLVLPKEHYENLFTIDKDVLDKMYSYIKDAYPKLKEKLSCDGLTIVQNNEYGQDVKHFHIHLIPRYDGEVIDMEASKNIEDIDEIYNKLMD